MGAPSCSPDGARYQPPRRGLPGEDAGRARLLSRRVCDPADPSSQGPCGNRGLTMERRGGWQRSPRSLTMAGRTSHTYPLIGPQLNQRDAIWLLAALATFIALAGAVYVLSS